MKIFYGVQGTGNGHITRARVMAEVLQNDPDIDVTFLFSGRDKNKYFDMDIFADYLVRQGLTFNTSNGQVSYIKTALQVKPIQFCSDVKNLDLSDFDLVITDFEPVTAWSAKTKKINALGIGHQYAFGHKIPRAGTDPLAELVMKFFAPVNTGLGFHWHHFDCAILPPLIETPELPKNQVNNKIVVYLPFENQSEIMNHLSVYRDFEFFLYSPVPLQSSFENVHCLPLSRDGFQKDLYDCQGIISNAGFELASESLQLGKKILAKPLHAQMEQLSNAEALRQLGYGHTMNDLDHPIIEDWLDVDTAIQISYPNIAQDLVNRFKQGLFEIDKDFTDQIWSQVKVNKTRL